MSTKARGARDCEAPDRGKTPPSACAPDASKRKIVLLPGLRPSGALTATGLRRHSQLRSHASVTECAAACKSSVDAVPGRDCLRLSDVHAAGALLHPARSECLVLRLAEATKQRRSIGGAAAPLRPPAETDSQKECPRLGRKVLLTYARQLKINKPKSFLGGDEIWLRFKRMCQENYVGRKPTQEENDALVML